MIRFQTSVILSLMLGFMYVPHSAVADSDVIDLSGRDFGPYRPDNRPELDEVEQTIVDRTNRFRAKHDLNPVATDKALNKTAADFAAFMARTGLYGHQADRRTPAERVRAHGYDYCVVAENIAYAFQTTGFTSQALAEKFMQGWIDSPPHRKNLLKPEVTEIGVGVAKSDSSNVFFAVQVFGRPQSESIQFSVSNQSDIAVSYSVGDRAFDLEPNVIRRHQICLSKKLTFAKSDKSFDLKNGDEFEATTVNGAISLTRSGASTANRGSASTGAVSE